LITLYTYHYLNDWNTDDICSDPPKIHIFIKQDAPMDKNLITQNQLKRSMGCVGDMKQIRRKDEISSRTKGSNANITIAVAK